MKTKTLSLFFLIIILSSCSKSLVYSPSINLPNKTLKAKEVDLVGGIELMPEARPEELGGKPTTIGLNGQIGYGFSKRINFSIKGWMDIEGRENFTRSGYSLSGQYIVPTKMNSRIILLPRFGIALYGNDIRGYGISSSLIYHESINNKLSVYIGGGLAWGFRFLEKSTNEDGEKKLPMGIGIIGNSGVAFEITKGIRINFELSPILQLNTFDDNQQFIFSPQIGIGYTIRKRKI